MKKYIIGLFLILLSVSSPLSAQKILEKAADLSCKCIEEKFDKSKDVSVNEAAVNTCIQGAFMSNIDGFTEEYGMEILSDQKQAMKIGEELGFLIAKDCPTFIEFSMQLAEGNDPVHQDADLEADTEEITGEILRVENTEFTHLILKNAQGREIDFIWLRYFEGSDQYKGNIQSLQGKTVTITYSETEVYLPKMQDYVDVKEITNIEVKN